MSLFKSSVLALIFLSLGACSHFKPKSNLDTGDQSASDAMERQEEKTEFADFNLEHDTMYDLLVAEIAAQRNQMNITLLNYIQQARHTRDPEVIKRAINAAQFSKDIVAIKELGLLWVEVEPDNPSAHQLMAYQYSIEKEYADAIHHIDRVIELGGNVSIESLAIGSQSLPTEDKETLLQLYEKLYTKHPDSDAVEYSLAIVLGNLERVDEALVHLNSVIARSPDFQPAYVLKSNILFEHKEKEVAMDFTEQGYERFPKNHALGRIYASLLIEAGRLEEAEQVFAELMQHYPRSPSFKLSHALVMLENNKKEEASIALNELLAQNVHTNEAHFYLGRIDDQNEDYDAAIEHYLSIDQSMHFEPSIERASYLLMKQDQFDEAIEALSAAREKAPSLATRLWGLQFKLLNSFQQKEKAMQTLNDALEEFPESEQLLYARAMMHDSQNDLESMERDLKKIIELNPENAVAINALGYTLADKTDRLQEALQLISLALQLKPENPAIMDSMGWVLFKLGKREEALVFLLGAFQKFSDGEVGAHLGEVLYSLGQVTEAREVWAKTLELNATHPVLLKTLERLEPSMLPDNTAENEAAQPEPEKPATKNDSEAQ
ncbi:MAG: hypothetical protein C9356_09450 [Oleiphilus sp.]|nr:MAG: hypothetical protein C9356_09450 [Oleiphilus sp.]